jgi:hypothetical protein
MRAIRRRSARSVTETAVRVCDVLTRAALVVLLLLERL